MVMAAGIPMVGIRMMMQENASATSMLIASDSCTTTLLLVECEYLSSVTN
jgi:hypothetical protein